MWNKRVQSIHCPLQRKTHELQVDTEIAQSHQ